MACSIGDAPKSRPHPRSRLVGTLAVQGGAKEIATERVGNRTRSGPCQPAYRGVVQAVNGVMEVGGTMGSLIGRVSRNDSIRAPGYMGANYGVASGRVSGNFGGGTRRAHTESGDCVGSGTRSDE